MLTTYFNVVRRTSRLLNKTMRAMDAKALLFTLWPG